MAIWLIGGTQESAELAKAIVPLNLPCWVSVVTESARSLYPVTSLLQIWVGRLSADQIPQFLHHHQIHCILDASHPFAADISRLAIDVAALYNIPYLRYERPSIAGQLRAADPIAGNVEYFDRFETLLNTDRLVNQRVLLTVGYRSLALFEPWQAKACLHTRILPSPVALEAAMAAGFTPDRIIALRPPISAALETALWQQWQISTVVTKASGTAGGEDIKQQVAAALKVGLLVIERPVVTYPLQTHDLSRALAFCQNACR